MLGVMFSVVGGFAFLVWSSYRSAARREELESREASEGGIGA